MIQGARQWLLGVVLTAFAGGLARQLAPKGRERALVGLVCGLLLTLALRLGLTEEETQRLLKLAGRPVLYARNRRDAALLYGLNHRLSLAETEELLGSLEVESLGSDI